MSNDGFKQHLRRKNKSSHATRRFIRSKVSEKSADNPIKIDSRPGKSSRVQKGSPVSKPKASPRFQRYVLTRDEGINASPP